MKVKFVPQNVECEIKLGESVMHVAQDNGIYIKSVCKGVPSCAECRVRIVDGDHNVLPPGTEELSLIGTGYFIDRRRLSCQLKCYGDITVDMAEQIAKQNGLISGQKKKKLAIKDDRIEDERAIRSDSYGESSDEAGGGDTLETPDQSLEAHPQPSPRPKVHQEASSESRSESPKRHTRPAPRPQNQPPSVESDGEDDDEGDDESDGGEAQQGASAGPDGNRPGGGGGRRRRRRRRGGRGGAGGGSAGGQARGPQNGPSRGGQPR